MAQLGEVFDPTKVKPGQPGSSGGDPIPDGYYKAHLVESELKRNSKNTGDTLKLKFEIIEGQGRGTWIYENLNWTNPNPVAQKIGREAFSGLCHACGYMNGVSDTAQVHNIPLGIKVKFVAATGTYKAKNEVTEFISLAKLAEVLQAPAVQPEQQAQQAQQYQNPAPAHNQNNGAQYQQNQQQQQNNAAPAQTSHQPQQTNGAADASWR